MTNDAAMMRALALAADAAADGEVPVGALVLDADGRVIGEGRNARGGNRPASSATGTADAGDGGTAPADPLAHAEVLAMRDAAARLGTWNLADCTLVVTLEPCPMCAGACLQTHVGRIVFGAWDAKLGACGSIWDIPRDPHIGHAPEVYGGVREAECAALLADFFAARR
ncbi:nucleoside deaminase [Bifidobacterium amazonense]|uniref:tRNA-specific adenosine deaminase n=1 Tax=Bifidobacterium amazonense TaxID=2809027 RepID=A0ABS9VTD5_9BIFI|nr:nucleoside deaminase [Bifidobacterium amazonense]MCH9275338.1 nucleoside deaminase [Bifidobacterium amazonense]